MINSDDFALLMLGLELNFNLFLGTLVLFWWSKVLSLHQLSSCSYFLTHIDAFLTSILKLKLCSWRYPENLQCELLHKKSKSFRLALLWKNPTYHFLHSLKPSTNGSVNDLEVRATLIAIREASYLSLDTVLFILSMRSRRNIFMCWSFFPIQILRRGAKAMSSQEEN